MITFNFHISDNPLARAIRLYSKYSHVSIEIGKNVYEAVTKDGVIKTPKKDFDYSDVVEQITIDVKSTKEVIKWLELQLGKKYDYLGVISFLWRFVPNRIGKWYCSELATVVLAKAFEAEVYDQKQTPEDFYYLANLVLSNLVK